MLLSHANLTALVHHLCESVAGARRTEGSASGVAYSTMRFRSWDSGALAVIKGQRDPAARYELLSGSVDFVNKTVLDLGCKDGGMILGVAEVARQAVGVDFDAALVRVGNSIVKRLGWSDQEVSFHTFDLNGRASLNTLLALSAQRLRFDIITMYAINVWMRYPVRVVLWALRHAEILVMEVDGDAEVQKKMIFLLAKMCRSVVERTDYKLCADCYPRRMFVCTTNSREALLKRKSFAFKIAGREA